MSNITMVDGFLKYATFLPYYSINIVVDLARLLYNSIFWKFGILKYIFGDWDS